MTAASEFLQDFLARQRELGRRSLAAVAALGQANMEMILVSGINRAQSATARAAMANGGFAEPATPAAPQPSPPDTEIDDGRESVA